MRTHLRSLTAGSACLLFAAVAGCSAETLEFADWLLPIPEGAPVKEYAHVPAEGRDADAVRLIEDLVIGDDLSNPDAILYEPTGVVGAPNGNIFVGDRGTNQIKMFGPDGTYVKSLGKEGQGPGEFAALSGITIAGDQLLVRDSRNARFSLWTLDGEHVADHTPLTRVSASYMHGLADGSFLSTFTDRDGTGDGYRIVARRTIEGEEISRLFEHPLPPLQMLESGNLRSMLQDALDSFDEPRVVLSVGGGEVAYISPLQEYQVMALSADGEALWALRVAWPRSPFPEETKEMMLESFPAPPDGQEPFRVAEFEWPPLNVAIASIATDGAGRLYVFPQGPADGAVPMTQRVDRPVDVFSPDGDFIAAGTVPLVWSSAQGEYVYGLRSDELDELVAVRYRLEISER